MRAHAPKRNQLLHISMRVRGASPFGDLREGGKKAWVLRIV